MYTNTLPLSVGPPPPPPPPPPLPHTHTELIPYETVVKELDADTVHAGASLGQHGYRFNLGKYSQAVFVTLKVCITVDFCCV